MLHLKPTVGLKSKSWHISISVYQVALNGH